MSSLNKVMIIGNLGKDPEISYTPSGLAVARFSVATKDVWNDKTTGEKTEKTEWHRIVAFGKTAENCGRYLAKGRPVFVEGRLQTTSYEKDGITRYVTDIIASSVQFLGSRDSGTKTGFHQNGYSQGHQPQPGDSTGSQQPHDDDIPF